MNKDNLPIVVVGLGYVGLPLAVALARHFDVTGLDIDEGRIRELRDGYDRTGEVEPSVLAASSLSLTADPQDCAGADIYIVTVPTPVDGANRPDLGPLIGATKTVARLIDAARAPIMVFESTVYPGVTEEICGPLIEAETGLRCGRDFLLGYSPERINPGDREHSIEQVIKVVAGQTPEVTERLAQIYGRVTSAGVFRAASIKAAEAAKVIENAQRDINIAFMNEITQIFARLDLSIWDVLDAAGTKWNFLKFHPGLVGGHCIGVDPYYLSHCAQSLGHLPRVVLAGRAINDGMGVWIADQIHSRRKSRIGHVLVLGLAFKENVPDLRNSRVIDLVDRLRWLGHQVSLHDPMVEPTEAERVFGTKPDSGALSGKYDIVIAAVGHQPFRDMVPEQIVKLVAAGGMIADLKGIWRHLDLGDGADRWTL